MANSPTSPFMNRSGFASRSVPRLGFGSDAVALSKSSEQWQKQLDDADQQQAQLFHLQWGLIKEQMTNMRTDIVNLTEGAMQKEADIQQLNAGMNQLSENFGGAIQNLEVQMLQQLQATSQEFRMALEAVKTERDVALDRFESRFVELEASTRARATSMEEQVTAIKAERDSQRATYRRWEQTIESVEQKLSTPDHIQQLFAALQERMAKQDELRSKMQQDLERADAAIRQDLATMKTQNDSKHHELRTDMSRKHADLQGHHDKLRQAIDIAESNHEQLRQAHDQNSADLLNQIKEQARTKGWHQDINDLRSKLTEHQSHLKGLIDDHRGEVDDKHAQLADELKSHRNDWNLAHGELKQSISQLSDNHKKFQQHVRGLQDDVNDKHNTAISQVKEHKKSHEALVREVDSQLQSHLQKMSTDHSNSHDAVRNNLSVLEEEIRRELGAMRNSHDEHRGHVKDVFDKHKSDAMNKQQELLNLLSDHRTETMSALRAHGEKQDRHRSDLRAAHEATEGHFKKQLDRISKDHAEKHGSLRDALDGHRGQAERMVQELRDLHDENHTTVKEDLHNVAKAIRKELAEFDEEHKSNHGKVRDLMMEHKNDHSSALTDLSAALKKDLRALSEDHGNAHQTTKEVIAHHKAILAQIPLAEAQARKEHKDELVASLEKLKEGLKGDISTLHREHTTGHQSIHTKFEEHRHEALTISEQLQAALQGIVVDHTEKASALEQTIMQIDDKHHKNIERTQRDLSQDHTEKVESTHDKLLQIINGHRTEFDNHKSRYHDPLRTIVKRLEVQLQNYQDRLDMVENAVTKEDEELRRQSDNFRRQMEEMELHMKEAISKEDEHIRQAMLDHDEETREQMRIMELKTQEAIRKEDAAMRRLVQDTDEAHKRSETELERRMQARVEREDAEMRRLAAEAEARHRKQLADVEGRLHDDISREDAELRKAIDERDAATRKRMADLQGTLENELHEDEAAIRREMQARDLENDEKFQSLRNSEEGLAKRLKADEDREKDFERRYGEDKEAFERRIKADEDREKGLERRYDDDKKVLERRMKADEDRENDFERRYGEDKQAFDRRMQAEEDRETGLERRMGGYEDDRKALERRIKADEDREKDFERRYGEDKQAFDRRMKAEEDRETGLERRMQGFEDDEKDMRVQMKGLRQEEDSIRDQMAQRDKRASAASGEAGGGRGGAQGGVSKDLQAKLESEISKLWEALETHTHETLPGGGVGRAVLPSKGRRSQVQHAPLHAPSYVVDPIVRRVSMPEVATEPIMVSHAPPVVLPPTIMSDVVMPPTTIMSSHSMPSLARTVVQQAPVMSPVMSPVSSPTGSRRVVTMSSAMRFPGFNSGSALVEPRKTTS